MGILDSILGKREPVVAYRTVDGGHPAPFPDMTDEQLYNYETVFNVPHKTFDEPPGSRVRLDDSLAERTLRREPTLPGSDPVREKVFDAPRYTRAADTPTVTRDHAHHGSPEIAPDTVQDSGQDGTQESTQEPRLEAMHESERESRYEPVRPEYIIASPPPVDLSKPVRTLTTKQPVEIITTRARHPVYKVQGYIGDSDVLTLFTLDGQISENGPRFLENIPPTHCLHLNIYRNPDPHSKEKYLVTQHETREEADRAALQERLACVRVDLE
jgi:hypothetical protein